MNDGIGGVLETVLEAARTVTAAGAGRIVRSDDAPGSESLEYVLTAGEPLALARSESDSRSESVLLVPCIADGEVVGVLELTAKADARSFTIDDLEIAGLLAGIAAAALVVPSRAST